MTRWSKNATLFSVSVTPNTYSKSSQCNIPEPILEALGNPTGLTFVLKKGGAIKVRSWNKTKDRQSTTKETYL